MAVNRENNQKHTGNYEIWKSMAHQASTLPWHIFHVLPEHEIKEDGCRWHQNPEFIIIKSGVMHVSIDGIMKILKPKDLCIISSCTVHTYSCHDTEAFIIEISCSYLKDRIAGFDQLMISSKAQNDDTLKGMLYEFLALEFSEDQNRLLIQLFFDMIIHYCSTQFLTMKTDLTDHHPYAFSTNILQYLESHYAQRFDSAQIEKEFHLSYPHIARCFKKQTGKSILQTLNDIRIRKSLILLEKRDMTIEQIADSLGFPNTRSFENAFRQRFHGTPYQYQKMTVKHQ